MTRRTKKFLKDLRYLFKKGSNQTCQEIWDIMTALRGPDSGINADKSATTAVIRHVVFGDTSKIGGYSAPDNVDNKNKRHHLDSGYHFYDHSTDAFEALGLKWDEVNK